MKADFKAIQSSQKFDSHAWSMHPNLGIERGMYCLWMIHAWNIHRSRMGALSPCMRKGGMSMQVKNQVSAVVYFTF